MDLDDLAVVADALGRDVDYFLTWLPRSYSKRQPAGFLGTRGRLLGTPQGYLEAVPRSPRAA